MPLPAGFIDELLERNRIEDVVADYVALTPRGNNLFGLCPFHSEKTPSFSVTSDKQIFYCFGCHKGGNAIHFIMEIENLSYMDAVRHLAKRAGMEVPEDEQYQSRYREQQKLKMLCKDSARFFRSCLLSEQGKQAREYIASRGFSAKTVNRFGFGYAPASWDGLLQQLHTLGYSDEQILQAGMAARSKKNGKLYDYFHNRLMVPIIDLHGDIIGFGGRALEQSVPNKYVNSPETILFNKRKNLFALNYAKKSKLDMLILTEGYMDAIALHQFGFDCAVASLGTALTQEQALLMSKYTNTVVLTYDSDAAGQNATARAIPILEKNGLQVKILRVRDAKDPDEFLHKFGPDRFRLLLEESVGQAEYRLQTLGSRFDMNDDAQRVEFLKQAVELIASFGNAVAREVYAIRAAEMAKLTPDAVKAEVEKTRQRLLRKQKRQQEKISLAPVRQLQPKVRSIRYENIRSARAEERLISLLCMQPELLERAAALLPEQFSVPLFAKALTMMRRRSAEGLSLQPCFLTEDMNDEERQHFMAVVQKLQTAEPPQALQDYIDVIQEEYRRRNLHTAEDLRKMQVRLKEKKGYGG